MSHTDELSFEDSNDVVSWSDAHTREWMPRYVNPRRASAPERSFPERRERPALWLYAACGTAAVMLGLISSRVLLSLFRPNTTEATQQALPNEQPLQASQQAALAAAQAPRAVLPVARKPARNHGNTVAKVSARGQSRSWELSTAAFSASADEPTKLDRSAEPDMDLMDIPSSPMEQRALAESRARGGDSDSVRNAIIDMQRQRDPMCQLDVMQDPGVAIGTLRINSRPWSQVYIDNKPVGTTPLLSMSVPTGRHSVRLVNQEFSMSKSFDVVVGPGERVTRVVSLDE